MGSRRRLAVAAALALALIAAMTTVAQAGSDEVTIDAGIIFVGTLETDPLNVIELGENVVITGNIEPDPPVGVDLVIDVPPNLEIVSTAFGAAYGTCTQVDNRITCAGSGGPGGDAAVRIDAIGIAVGPGNVSVNAGVPGVAEATLVASTNVVNPGADLAVTLTGPDTIGPTTTAIQATVDNLGTVALENVSVEVTATSEVDLSNARWGAAGTACPVVDNVAICELGTLDRDGQVIIEVDGDPIAEGTAAITATATSTTPELQPDPTPNDAQRIVSILPVLADLGLSISTQPIVGETPVDGSVTVGNFGNVTLTGVEVEIDATSPLALSNVRWGPQATACVELDTAYRCSIGVVNIAQEVVIDFDATADAEGTGTIRAVATTSTPEGDPDPSPNTVESDVSARPRAADLQVELTELTGSSPSFDRLSLWAIRLDNLGPDPAVLESVVFQIPAGHVYDRFVNPDPLLSISCSAEESIVTCVSSSTIPRFTLFGIQTQPVDRIAGQATAVVSGIGFDPDLTNNTSTVSVDAAALPVFLTPDECAILDIVGDQFGYGTATDALAAWIEPVEAFVGPQGPDAGQDLGETCELPLSLDADELAALQVLSDRLGVSLDEAAAQVARFLVGLYVFFFGPL